MITRIYPAQFTHVPAITFNGIYYESVYNYNLYYSVDEDQLLVETYDECANACSYERIEPIEKSINAYVYLGMCNCSEFGIFHDDSSEYFELNDKWFQ